MKCLWPHPTAPATDRTKSVSWSSL